MSGIILPERPEKPLPSDCCNSGCTPCILDVYDDLMKQWERNCNNIQNEETVSEAPMAEQCPTLSQTKYTTFRVTSITALTSDTNLYQFQAVFSDKINGPEGEVVYRELKSKLDFRSSQYLMLQGRVIIDNEEKNFTRAFTPLSDSTLSLKGCFNVVIKLYPNGKMSQYVQRLAIGDITNWRGPYGGFDYNPNTFKWLLMLCAGTGIAPLYSMARSIVSNEVDDTIIKMLYCCKDQASILLRKEIHALQSFWNFSADIYLPYSCNSNCNSLYGETLKTVRLGQDDISLALNGRNCSDIMVLICGGPQFCEEVLQYVRNCGVDPQHIHTF